MNQGISLPKVQAFTLAETLVVMVLVSIVVLFGFLALNLFFRETGATLKILEQVNRQQESIYRMSLSFEKSELITLTDSVLNMTMPNSEILRWSFSKGNCTLQDNKTASVPYSLLYSSCYFYYRSAAVATGLVDKVVIQSDTSQISTLVFYKWYSAGQTLQYKRAHDTEPIQTYQKP